MESTAFEYTIEIALVVNFINLTLTSNRGSQTVTIIQNVLNLMIALIFAIEMAIKLAGRGFLWYFADRTNQVPKRWCSKTKP